jgi:serine/threonine protein kinase
VYDGCVCLFVKKQEDEIGFIITSSTSRSRSSTRDATPTTANNSMDTTQSGSTAGIHHHHHQKQSQETLVVEEEQEQQELFRVVEGLGRGGFGTVMRVNYVTCDDSSGETMKLDLAMKVLPRDEKGTISVVNELMALKALKDSPIECPFVSYFYEAFSTTSCWCLVSELIEGGDAYQHILSKHTKLSENFVRVILAELYLALEHVHSCGIIHCDVRAENVMFDSQGHVKLIDFGLSKVIVRTKNQHGELEEPPLSQHISENHTGRLLYMPPELIIHQTGGRHTDWWAYGVFAFELLTGWSPWTMTCIQETMDQIKYQEPYLPAHVTRQAQDLVRALLHKNFKERLGTQADVEITQAAFFYHTNWEELSDLKHHHHHQRHQNHSGGVGVGAMARNYSSNFLTKLKNRYSGDSHSSGDYSMGSQDFEVGGGGGGGGGGSNTMSLIGEDSAMNEFVKIVNTKPSGHPDVLTYSPAFTDLNACHIVHKSFTDTYHFYGKPLSQATSLVSSTASLALPMSLSL